MPYSNPGHAFALGSTLGIVLAGSAGAATITVDDDLQDLPSAQFTNLSAAVAAAQPGDRILVHPGVYRETLECAKAITIVGVGGHLQTFIDGEGVRGCAILGDSGPLQASSPITLEGFTLVNGAAPRGGGVQVRDWTRMENCRVLDCIATQHGGGIHVGGFHSDLLFEVHNLQVTGCSAPNGQGGGIGVEGIGPDERGAYGHALTRMVVTGGLLVSDNHARFGGGLSLQCATFDEGMNRRGLVRFRNNSATFTGGGVHAALAAFLGSKETRMEFANNWSELGSGGGMYFGAQQSTYASWNVGQMLALHDATFTENTAFEDGGGLDLHDSDATVAGCRFQGNITAQGAGGAIASVLSNLAVGNTRFVANHAPANSASTPSAGGIDALGGSLSIQRGWFQDHDTAVQVIGCLTAIRGSVFKDNTLALLNVGIQSDLLVRNCYFEGNQQALSGPATNLGGIVIVP